MATNDSELIAEVRGLTDYDAAVMSDSEIQTIIDIGKEELRAEYGKTNFPGFYSGNLSLDRALFWFTCIGVKVRSGEISGVNLTVGDIDMESGDGDHELWFTMFSRRLKNAGITGGMAQTNSTRSDDRNYEYDKPEGAR